MMSGDDWSLCMCEDVDVDTRDSQGPAYYLRSTDALIAMTMIEISPSVMVRATSFNFQSASCSSSVVQ